jgi:hypothetical protein
MKKIYLYKNSRGLFYYYLQNMKYPCDLCRWNSVNIPWRKKQTNNWMKQTAMMSVYIYSIKAFDHRSKSIKLVNVTTKSWIGKYIIRFKTKRRQTASTIMFVSNSHQQIIIIYICFSIFFVVLFFFFFFYNRCSLSPLPISRDVVVVEKAEKKEIERTMPARNRSNFLYLLCVVAFL